MSTEKRKTTAGARAGDAGSLRKADGGSLPTGRVERQTVWKKYGDEVLAAGVTRYFRSLPKRGDVRETLLERTAAYLDRKSYESGLGAKAEIVARQKKQLGAFAELPPRAIRERNVRRILNEIDRGKSR